MRPWESQCERREIGTVPISLAVSLLDELGQEGEELIKASVVGGLKLVDGCLELFKASIDRADIGLEFGNFSLDPGNFTDEASLKFGDVFLDFRDILFDILGSFVYGFVDEFESYFAREGLDTISHNFSVTRER